MHTIQPRSPRDPWGLYLAAILLPTSLAACALPDDDDDRDDATSEVASAVTDPNDTSPIEPPPRSFTFHAISSRQINYSFQCGAHATHHDVVRRDPSGAVVNVAFLSVCPGTFYLADNDVQPGTPYCYQVIASNSEQSAVSTEECITAPLDFDPPALPASAGLSVTQTTATLEFIDQSTNEGGFRVYLRAGTGPFTLIQTFQRPVRADRSTGEHFTVTRTGLARDTSYTFKVEVFHDFAPVVVERLFPFTTLPDPPTAPGNFRVTGTTSNTLSLAWADSSFETSYRLITIVSVGNLDQTISANSTSLTLTNLYPSARYCFKLRAENRAGTAESAQACATTASGDQPIDVFMFPDPPPAGLLSFVGTLGSWTGAKLNSLVLRSNANPLEMTGIALIPPTAPSSACHDASVRVLVPINGTATSADLTKLYGSATPSISNGLAIRGCVIPETLPVTIRPIITAHVTTP